MNPQELFLYQQGVRQQRQARVAELIAEGKQDQYVHLHGHDTHSIRDATAQPKPLMEKIKSLGMTAISVTNHGNINGWVEEADAAKEFGIKLIPGVEVYECDDRTIHAYKDDAGNKINPRYHMVMWAMTHEGYYNLIKIMSDAGVAGKFGGRNRTDLDFIEFKGLGKGIRVSTACLAGRMPRMLANGDVQGAIAFVRRLQSIFDEVYLELQDNGLPEQELLNAMILNDIWPATNAPLILNRDYHYLEKPHGDMHDTFKALAYGDKKNDPNRGSGKYASSSAFYVSGPEEMWEYVRTNNIPHEAIYNGIELAEACTAKVELGKSFFPKFPKIPKGYTEKTYLRKVAYEGLMDYVKYCGDRDIMIDVNEYMDRLGYELSVIAEKGYDGYFLIIWDVIRWCWENGIITGPGRGSAAGSLLSFCLKITRLDPIRRGLLFERFLNPFRESWPDIDFDIPSRHRARVMGYVLDTYGADHVSQIISYTTMGVRSVIRDVVKALQDDNDPQCPYNEELAKMIAATIPMKMPDQGEVNYKRIKEIAEHPDKFVTEWGEHKARKVINQCQEFMKYMAIYPYIEDHLKVLEGAITSTSLHAGGVVICPVPIADVIPIELSKGDTAVLPVACWDSEYAEKAGFMKMDFLGLMTLDVVDITFNYIERCGVPRPDMYEIGREDPAVFKTICDGLTHGVFQISGDGLTSYLKQAKPHDMDSWCDVIALYRPGPLDAKVDGRTTIAEKYVENGNPDLRDDWISQLDSTLRKIYRRTRGVMVYQEQVMQICQEVAGYSLGDADTFRRIIGKKKVTEVKALRYQFIYGGQGGIDKAQAELDSMKEANATVQHDLNEQIKEQEEAIKVLKKNKNTAAGGLKLGYDLAFLNSMYDQMVAFAGYAFNRSHSDVYADLGYVTAWCKTYYPAQFMAALLTMEDQAKEMESHYAEVKRLGVPLLGPDINKSHSDFTVELTDDGRWALRMGLTAIKGLGNKVSDHIINQRRDIAGYIQKYGDIDPETVGFIPDQPFADFADFVSRIDRRTVNRSFLQLLVKAGCVDSVEPKLNRHELLNYISDNLITEKAAKFHLEPDDCTDKVCLGWEKELLGVYVSSHPFESLPYQPLTTVRDGETVDIGGQITGIKKIKTKKGDTMGFVNVQTQNEKFDVTLFPKEWTEFEDRIWKDNVLIFRVKKETKDKVNWIVDKVLYAKKDQVVNLAVADRPDDVPKRDKAAKGKKAKATLEDFGGAVAKDDPLLDLFA